MKEVPLFSYIKCIVQNSSMAESDFTLKLDLFLQASCKKKLHLPLLKSAFFQRGGGGGANAKMGLNSWAFALWRNLETIICHNLWNFQVYWS